MTRITSLVLRRMRPPLLVLLAAYTVSILGLTLVPGVDDQGRPWRMDFFEAYYFVSYMATTIGFGELPYEFSDAQRMWVTVCIYITVIAWIYAIGVILNLIQDRAFRAAVIESVFARSVRHLGEPFYLICGYGDTGRALVRALSDRFIRAVVVDSNQEAIDDLQLKNYPVYVPGLCANAALPPKLLRAGLSDKHCAGVVAVTHKDELNLKIAIVSKLVHPDIPVICRAETPDYIANIASFGTEHIINPFETFAAHLAAALRKPGHFLLYEWLTDFPYSRLPEPLYPPSGKWILCGYGRFGKAVYRRLLEQGAEVLIIEADPEHTRPPSDTIVGRGTEADTLLQAGIEDAVGIVAGTDIDANNLSIIMTARELNPSLFTVIRQNRAVNKLLFRAIKTDLVMQASEITAREVRIMLTVPLLNEFLQRMGEYDNQWANEVASRILAVMGELVPDVWWVSVEAEALELGGACPQTRVPVQVRHLYLDPRNRVRRQPCVPLLLKRGEEAMLMPADDTSLRAGDRLLFCGEYGIGRKMNWVLHNSKAMTYVVTGCEAPDGFVFRWINRRWKGSVNTLDERAEEEAGTSGDRPDR